MYQAEGLFASDRFASVLSLLRPLLCQAQVIGAFTAVVLTFTWTSFYPLCTAISISVRLAVAAAAAIAAAAVSAAAFATIASAAATPPNKGG